MTAIDLDCLEQDELPISILDWRSRASHRVVTSTFSAETAACLEGHGMAFYMRALLCEAMFGWSGSPVTEYGEDQMPLTLFTDCRSLYDHVKVAGNVPDDRHDAVWLGALKSHVSCGPQRDESKAGLRWLPSRWMIRMGRQKGA